MDVRVFLFLLVLGTSSCSNARVVTTNFSPGQNGIASVLQQINHQQQEREVEAVEEFGADAQLCTLCQIIATPVLSYLSNSATQEQITSALSSICSLTFDLKDKCSTVVQSFLPLIFLQLSTWTPKLFCVQIGLCDLIISTSQHLSKNSCESCHDLAAEALQKLKDPDTQLDTIEVLLKACDAVEGFEGFVKCKTLVSSYASLILGSAKQFLERNDVCTILNACNSATNAAVQTSVDSDILSGGVV